MGGGGGRGQNKKHQNIVHSSALIFFDELTLK